MPKSKSYRRHSRRRRAFSLAGGSGAATYVAGVAGDMNTQFNNAYGGHLTAPTGGGMWVNGNQNVAYQAAAGTTPLMSGGRRRRSRRHRRSSHRKTSKSWFSKLF